MGTVISVDLFITFQLKLVVSIHKSFVGTATTGIAWSMFTHPFWGQPFLRINGWFQDMVSQSKLSLTGTWVFKSSVFERKLPWKRQNFALLFTNHVAINCFWFKNWSFKLWLWRCSPSRQGSHDRPDGNGMIGSHKETYLRTRYGNKNNQLVLAEVLLWTFWGPIFVWICFGPLNKNAKFPQKRSTAFCLTNTLEQNQENDHLQDNWYESPSELWVKTDESFLFVLLFLLNWCLKHLETHHLPAGKQTWILKIAQC